MAACLFVYYRVDAAHQLQANEAVAAVFAAVRNENLEPRLMCRHHDADTWMEVYAPADADLQSRLELAVQQSGLLSYLQDGRRHCEYFIDMPTTTTSFA